MKKKIAILTAALLMGAYTQSLFAGTAKKPATVAQQVKKELVFPEFLKGKTEKTKAIIAFTIDENGKAGIREMHAPEEVKEFLKEKIENMAFAKGTYEAGREIVMQIVFRYMPA